MSEEHLDVDVRPWSEGDLPVLERLLGDPAMTEHLGGPETAEKLLERHRRYCRISDSGDGGTFVIVVGPEKAAAGWTGYWETGWGGAARLGDRLECASRVPGPRRGHQGDARSWWSVHAPKDDTGSSMPFRAIDNGSSNAICRKAGFALQDEVDIEYPPGHSMRCNDWRLDLFT